MTAASVPQERYPAGTRWRNGVLERLGLRSTEAPHYEHGWFVGEYDWSWTDDGGEGRSGRLRTYVTADGGLTAEGGHSYGGSLGPKPWGASNFLSGTATFPGHAAAVQFWTGIVQRLAETARRHGVRAS
ncbi:hypothetical protein ACIBI3_21865 [Actinomadura luteofluorescens]|uniref:hypothetical protein n=1 Tax=Actinomadura luteofluorescens TaxID=46163 RepID=UPI0034879DA2